MFKKCLKYDLKAFSKLWLIASAAMIFIGLVCGFGIGSMIGAIMDSESTIGTESTFFEGLSYIARFLAGMIGYMGIIYAVTIYVGGNSIVRIIHYYSKCFSDQGYLTFTLPVKRSTLFWSKAMSHWIYLVGSMIVCVISIVGGGLGAIGGLALSPVARQNIFGALDLAALFANLKLSTVIYVLILLVLIALLALAVSFAMVMLDHLIVTLAATMFRRLKVLSVIVSYYVCSTVIAFPVIYLGIYYMMFALAFGAMGLSVLVTSPILVWIAIYLAILMACALLATVGMTLSNLTVRRLERKINLA